MSFNIRSLGTLVGKTVDEAIPSNARMVSERDVDPVVSPGVTTLGFHESSFDVDGDGRADVLRRDHLSAGRACSTTLAFMDAEGNRAVAHAINGLVGGALNPVSWAAVDVDDTRTVQADYDADRKVDWDASFARPAK